MEREWTYPTVEAIEYRCDKQLSNEFSNFQLVWKGCTLTSEDDFDISRSLVSRGSRSSGKNSRKSQLSTLTGSDCLLITGPMLVQFNDVCTPLPQTFRLIKRYWTWLVHVVPPCKRYSILNYTKILVRAEHINKQWGDNWEKCTDKSKYATSTDAPRARVSINLKTSEQVCHSSRLRGELAPLQALLFTKPDKLLLRPYELDVLAISPSSYPVSPSLDTTGDSLVGVCARSSCFR